MPIGPQWRGVRRAAVSDEMEESLRRTMDEDPRLASGVSTPRVDNVLDFIQMTGLTTGRVPDSAARAAVPDDHISFFEHGVRDVDGSGDPVELEGTDIDGTAFRINAQETSTESRSIIELRQIIADLAEMESEVGDSAAQREYGSLPRPAPRNVEPFPVRDTRPPVAVDADPTVVLDVDQSTDDIPEVEVDLEDEEAEDAVEAYDSPMKSPAGLAAARDLLFELAKANDAAERVEEAFARTTPRINPELSLPPSPAAHPELPDDPTTHQGFRHRRPPSAGRWIVRGLIVALAIGVGAGAFVVYDRAVQPPRAAYESAESLIDRARFEDASSAFIEFTKRFPGHPRRADAMYMAGFALQLVPEDPAPRAKEAYTESIEMLRAFVEAYPAHEKTPRAETMMGVLYYKTGRYLEAINILGDPERRLRDQGAYLTALRTLGRSYAAVNQVDNARSAFMRAGALESNIAPDEDYAELAGLYTQMAERSGDPAQRRWYFAQAVEQWDFALQVPGLLKSRKDDMKLLRDVAASKADDEFSDMSTGGQAPLGRLRTPSQKSLETRGGAPSAGE